jgi:hypothetical protein
MDEKYANKGNVIKGRWSKRRNKKDKEVEKIKGNKNFRKKKKE